MERNWEGESVRSELSQTLYSPDAPPNLKRIMNCNSYNSGLSPRVGSSGMRSAQRRRLNTEYEPVISSKSAELRSCRPLIGPAGRQELRPSNSRLMKAEGPTTILVESRGFHSWNAAMRAISDVIDTKPYQDYTEEMSVGQFITNKFNIRKVLLTKGSKVFKMDYLVVSVKSIIPADPNLILVVTDKTGQMLGCLHKDAMATYRNNINPGSTILLRDVSIYVPAGHNPYILITRCNIKRIFDGAFSDSETS